MSRSVGRGKQNKRLSQNLSLKSVTNRPPNVTYGRERGGVGGEEGCLQVLPLEEVMEVLANWCEGQYWWCLRWFVDKRSVDSVDESTRRVIGRSASKPSLIVLHPLVCPHQLLVSIVGHQWFCRLESQVVVGSQTLRLRAYGWPLPRGGATEDGGRKGRDSRRKREKESVTKASNTGHSADTLRSPATWRLIHGRGSLTRTPRTRAPLSRVPVRVMGVFSDRRIEPKWRRAKVTQTVIICTRRRIGIGNDLFVVKWLGTALNGTQPIDRKGIEKQIEISIGCPTRLDMGWNVCKSEPNNASNVWNSQWMSDPKKC